MHHVPVAVPGRTRVLLRCGFLAGALGVGTACTAGRPMTPASLAGSRQLVSVTYPAPQTLRARAASRDSLLHRVTAVVGWPATVRGDTLELQLAEWRADGRVYEMRSPDYVVAVPSEAGATIRAGREGGAGTVVVGLALLAAAVVIAALSNAPF